MSGMRANPLIEDSSRQPDQWVKRVRVDVESIAKPEPESDRKTYRCDAEIRVSEGDHHQTCDAKLTVHHPRGWMGVEAGFIYELDVREFPTFEARAEAACLRVVSEFPADQIISVFLLGTNEADFD